MVNMGHQVICCVRDPNRFHPPQQIRDSVEVLQTDLLKPETLENIPEDIDGAYYLVHSMSSSTKYQELEKQSATNFRDAIEKTRVKHVIYLSGIINEDKLSEHLASRKNVEDILGKGKYNFTTLRAGIIIGSGSASFEIIRDMVEKLPVMVAPRWLKTKCQPIGIADVISFLSQTLFHEKTFNKDFDIGGPDVLTYKEMLLGYAEARELKRRILIVPVMTPRLSSYWLYFVTSTSYKLAIALVDSMKVNVVCRNKDLEEILDIQPEDYISAIHRAFSRIRQNNIVSSWKDSYVSSGISHLITDNIEVPVYGCFTDQHKRKIEDREECIRNIWSIGGKNGWYYGNWLWQIRGVMDKMVGGVGLRRGRTNPDSINAGDALDFWRVLYANRGKGRLILFAEMKLPGEAWLDFKMENDHLIQTATFRPKGLLGRIYWYSVVPFHGFIFKGLLKKLAG